MEKLTRDQIEQMREWVIDCAVNDRDLEDRIEADDDQIISYVKRYYSGGIEEFLRTCE